MTKPVSSDLTPSVAEAYGIDELPDVQAERTISVLEAADVLAECMTEAGFPMKVDEAGLVAGELEESQEGAHKLAMVTCWLRFPLDDKYVQPPNDQQLRVHYEWTLDETLPCMRELGFTPPSMPSFESFVADFRAGRGMFLPHFEYPDAAPSILESCPADPPLELLWAD